MATIGQSSTGPQRPPGSRAIGAAGAAAAGVVRTGSSTSIDEMTMAAIAMAVADDRSRRIRRTPMFHIRLSVPEDMAVPRAT